MKKEENIELELNKDIARLFIQVWGKGELDIIDEFASPDFSIYYPSFPNVIKGIAFFKQLLTKARSVFGDMEIEIDEEIAENDKIVLCWTYSGTHQVEWPPGVPLTAKRIGICEGLTTFPLPTTVHTRPYTAVHITCLSARIRLSLSPACSINRSSSGGFSVVDSSLLGSPPSLKGVHNCFGVSLLMPFPLQPSINTVWAFIP